MNNSSSRRTDTHSFSLYYQNIRGCRTKLNDLSASITSSNFDLIALSETWLDSDISDSEIVNSGYVIFRKDRNFDGTRTSRGGGVLLAVSVTCACSQLNTNTFHVAVPSIDVIGIKVVLGKYSHYVFNVYVPPNLPFASYDTLFRCFYDLTYLNEPNSKVIIVGDFNLADYIKYSNKSFSNFPPLIASLYNFMNFFDLNQFNFVPNHNNRILDLILSNVHLIASKSLDPLLPTDPHHPPLDIQLDASSLVGKRNRITITNTMYNFKRANFALLYEKILEVDWDFLNSIDDVNVACSKFYSALDGLFSLCVPKKLSRKSSYPVWFTPDIIRNIKRKNRYHRRYKTTGDLETYNLFSSLRSQIKKDIYLARLNFIRNAEKDLHTNPSHFWSYINSLNNVSDVPTCMTLNNIELTCTQEVVDGFASFFNSAFIKSSTYDPNALVDVVNVPSLSVSHVSEELVLKCLKHFTSTMTSGPDGIPSFLLKDCAIVFVKPLTILFNLILKSCCFPSTWKTSKICPVFKSGDRSNVANYRPIVILCNFSKLFELVFQEYLLAHIRPQISEYQHGFISGRSTISNLVSITQYIANILDNAGQVDIIFTDFSKAFDRLDHGILLIKLSRAGLDLNLLTLFNSYLCERRMTVQVNGFKSNEFVATSGVPQGSVLGPLLFIIFINDICKNLCSHILLYADDCKVFGRVDSLKDCETIQSDLNKLKNWCDVNSLPLNINKCKVMSFCRKKVLIKFAYNIADVELEVCTSFKDLGVIFDPKLSFIYHINMVIKSSYKQLGFIIRNSKSFTDIKTLKTLYFAFVRSRLEYASVVWCPGYELYINCLERVQRRFLKYLTFNCDCAYPERGTPQSALLNRFDINLLSTRRKLAGFVFLYKLLNNLLDSPSLLSNINFHVPRVNSRNSNIFSFPVPHTNVLLFSPLYRVCAEFLLFQDEIDLFFCSIAIIKRIVLNS